MNNTYQSTLEAPFHYKENITENAVEIKKASLIVRAIDSVARQKIIELINRHGKVTVTEIYTELNLDQPIVSRHLAVLRQAKMVNTQREGKFIFYTVNQHGIDRIMGCIKQLMSAN